MPRPILVILLTLSLLVNGCASQQTRLPPGEDPDRLVEVIARRGQGEGPPVDPGPPGSPVLGNCLKTGAKVAASGAVLAVVLGIVCGIGLTHGNVGGLNGLADGLGGALKGIWSTD